MAAPSITAISPATGSAAGGSAVLITGTGFATATAVYFGTKAATAFTIQSSTTITATAPAQVAGVVRVKVTNPDGDSPDTATDDFTYTGSQFTLCTRAQVKARGKITDAGQDDVIDGLLDVVTQRLNVFAGREFLPQVTEARTFRVDGYRVRLDYSDLRAVTSAVLHPGDDSETTLTEGTDFTFELERLTSSAGFIRLADAVSLDSTFSSNFGFAQLTVTGDWGIWEQVGDVHADVNMAAIECVLAWLDKPIANITSLEALSEQAAVPTGSPSWDVPTSAYRKLTPYIRRWGVA